MTNFKDVSRIRRKNYQLFDIKTDFSLTYFPKSKSVKELDIMTYGPYLTGIDFFVSEKAKDIITSFVNRAINIIPVKIANNNYYLIGIPIIEYEEIDFKKTIFLGLKGVELQFQNVDEYKSYDKSLIVKNLVLKGSDYCHIIGTVWGLSFRKL